MTVTFRLAVKPPNAVPLKSEKPPTAYNFPSYCVPPKNYRRIMVLAGPLKNSRHTAYRPKKVPPCCCVTGTAQRIPPYHMPPRPVSSNRCKCTDTASPLGKNIVYSPPAAYRKGRTVAVFCFYKSRWVYIICMLGNIVGRKKKGKRLPFVWVPINV